MVLRNGKSVTLLGGTMLMAGFALAQEPPERGRRGGFPWDSPRVKQELGLTDEQVTKLKTQSFEAAKEQVKIQSQVRVAEIELGQLMDAASPDEKAVSAKAKEIGDLRTRIFQARVAERLAVKKVLTAEQQQKLRELGPRHPRGPREGGPERGPGRRLRPGPERRPEPDEWDDDIGGEIR